MTLSKKKIDRIIELNEGGNMTIEEIAKAVDRCASTVKKYTSDDYKKDNEIDEKSALNLTKRMIEEGYTFDEIEPLGYSLKLQANEIDITLFDYLTDINNIMGNFLKITNTPERFYYVFLELANNLSVLTDHIEANDLINAVNNFYDREISMENAELYITEIETKTELLVNNAKEEYTNITEKIEIAQKEHTKLTSLNTVICMKMLEDPDREKLKIAEKREKDMENELKRLQTEKEIYIQKCKLLEQSDKDNEITKQENIVLKIVYERLHSLFPKECDSIIKELEIETQ